MFVDGRCKPKCASTQFSQSSGEHGKPSGTLCQQNLVELCHWDYHLGLIVHGLHMLLRSNVLHVAYPVLFLRICPATCDAQGIVLMVLHRFRASKTGGDDLDRL